ncbi:MAG: glutamate N-acetyltransferase / amino-acid N-acetyltransferase, partial [Candidatus Binatota bacterium]|nr:glutamate N-acetyltransferase / amino-acid N-acetyltransferase [Candidatus Binatota bacterium]
MRLEIPHPAIEVPGFRFAGIACGLKDDGQRDLALIACDGSAVAAGAFTRNRFPAPPVEIARERVRGGRVQAVVVNTKSA